MNENFYIVIIEWDGGRIPTKWYNRLSSFGLSVSGVGGKEVSPIARRFSQHGVIHQEGTILVPSSSTAHVLAHLAKEMGAKAVSVGTIELEDLLMSSSDIETISRISLSIGRRGRPAKNSKVNWVITCKDEAKSFEWEGIQPVSCPNCGSFSIQFREGVRHTFSLTDKNPMKFWQESRFVGDSSLGFEEPIYDPIATCPEAQPITDETKTLWNTTLMKGVLEAWKKNVISVETVYRYADIAYAISKMDASVRLSNRLSGITAHIKRGGQSDGIVLAVTNDIDKFDALSMNRSSLTDI